MRVLLAAHCPAAALSDDLSVPVVVSQGGTKRLVSPLSQTATLCVSGMGHRPTVPCGAAHWSVDVHTLCDLKTCVLPPHGS